MIYGADVSTYPDLDPTFAWSSDARMLAEAIARRLETPPGSLAYDPDYGLDLRAYVNDDMGPRDAFILGAQIKTELEKEERVLAVTVAVTQSMALQTLRIDIGIEPSDAPDFLLTLGIDAVGAKVLAVTP